jgi:hypothetical protein
MIKEIAIWLVCLLLSTILVCLGVALIAGILWALNKLEFVTSLVAIIGIVSVALASWMYIDSR